MTDSWTSNRGDDTGARGLAPAAAEGSEATGGHRTDPRIASLVDRRDDRPVALSIIVVGYQAPDQLRECLDSLRAQTRRDFEVIIVDNGSASSDVSWWSGLSAACARLEKNYLQIIARNIGASLCRSGLILFLDEDSVLEPGSVRALVDLYEHTDVVASRCRLRTRADTVFNQLATHYDLGDEPIDGYLLESGLAIRREVFSRFGGYDEDLVPGGEYLFWLYHVGKNYGLHRAIYFPGAVIRTDFARSLRHFLWKSWVYAKGIEVISARFPEFLAFRNEIAAARPQTPTRLGFRAGLLRRIGRALFRYAGLYYRLALRAEQRRGATDGA